MNHIDHSVAGAGDFSFLFLCLPFLPQFVW